MYRDHEPITFEEFKGLWRRGDPESCPKDHSPNCQNVQFGYSFVETRDGITTYRAVGNPVRIHKYTIQDDNGQSILILNDVGELYHCLNEVTIYGPILTIPAMTDFKVSSIAGRALITPFTTTFDPVTNQAIEKGLQNDFLYIYKGDGSPARKAAGFGPTDAGNKQFQSVNSAVDGFISKGIHLVAIAFDGGPLGPEIFGVVDAPGEKEVQLFNVPIGPGGTVIRNIAITKAIDPKDYDPATVYPFFDAGNIPNNTDETWAISIADHDLTVPYAPGGGSAPVQNAFRASNTVNNGFCDFGFRIIAIVYETDTGFLTKPGPQFFAGMTTVNVGKTILVENIPVSPDPFVTKRHLISTKVIPTYNGDQVGFQFFFIPEGTIENNVDTSLEVSYYDADLLEDASYLLDLFEEIAAGALLTTYHGRLVLGAQYTDESLLRVSEVGEPEAINQVDGLVIIPLDGNPVTTARELRDVLYTCKAVRTYAVIDNNDVPSAWRVVTLEQGVGAPVHGVAEVLDSGGVDLDYLLMASLTGVMLFNGSYQDPELSWKIEDLWKALEFNDFRKIQFMNDTVGKNLYILLPNGGDILVGDYSEGLDPKNIKWVPWNFEIEMTTISLIERNRLILGAIQEL